MRAAGHVLEFPCLVEEASVNNFNCQVFFRGTLAELMVLY